jgi:PAS domain S-box-containing protein
MVQSDRILLITATDDDPPFPFILQRPDGTRVGPHAAGPSSWISAVREHEWDLVLCQPELVREHAFERGQREVLELIAAGAPLSAQLEHIVLLIEAQAPGMVCSILLFDRDRKTLHTGAAPHLPLEFVRAIEGAKVGPNEGSCGAAACRNELVIVEDIATHENWANYRQLALPHGLRACWSSPIRSVGKDVLGTFAMYFTQPRGPGPMEMHWVDRAAHIAAIAIERERSQAKQQLQHERIATLAALLDQAHDAILVWDVRGAISYWNDGAERLYGWTSEAAHGQAVGPLIHRDPAQFEAALQSLMQSNVWRGELMQRTRTGKLLVIEASWSLLRDEQGNPKLVLAIHTDITGRRELELQVFRAQRLESLGVMASGIAHDFNNILTAISANAGLASVALDPSIAREALTQIEHASERGAELVRQLFAFARQQEPKRKPVELAQIVMEALSLVRTLLPRNVEVRTAFAADVPRISADATQIHQVLVNLVTNAAHAMAQSGGVLGVRADRVVIDTPLAAQQLGLRLGTYARLQVSDTGTGMSEATLQRIFDPFFTTKAPSQGTGLGLAVVHGIVKDHQGAIVVHSTLGSGTVFEIYFPAVTD